VKIQSTQNPIFKVTRDLKTRFQHRRLVQLCRSSLRVQSL